MATSSGVNRRRSFKQQVSVEDQALNQISKEAEARIAASKLARNEARTIRTRELERQRLEEEEKEKQLGTSTTTKDGTKESTVITNRTTIASSSSNGSVADDLSSEEVRRLKKDYTELEEKYRKSLVQTAQLDNEKLMYRYEAELRKEETEDLEEQLHSMKIKNKEQVSELLKVKRSLTLETEQTTALTERLRLFEDLIRQNGLVLVSQDEINNSIEDQHDVDGVRHAALIASSAASTVLLSNDMAQILQGYSGSLEGCLQQIVAEKKILEKQVQTLTAELDDVRQRLTLNNKPHSPGSTNGLADGDLPIDVQKELNEYRFRIKKAEQEITTLEGNSSRLESQVRRFKTASETAEKNEEELKVEKRKLQRELREAQVQLEELTEQNNALKNRMEKMRKEKVGAVK